LWIENHINSFARVHEAGIAVVGLSGEPVGLEHRIKDVCDAEEKEKAK
jgi:hypothetical protein